MNENQVPEFLKPIYKSDPELYNMLFKTMNFAHAEGGALEPKYKHLLSMVADALCNHPGGTVACARAAMEAGATAEQVKEAMRVVFSAGGMPMVIENMDVYSQILSSK